VNHFQPGILAWVLGKHDSETFRPLWHQVERWRCYFYVTDGWTVYPCFIAQGDHIVSKTYMTRVVRAASPLGRRGKHSIATLPSSVASQDFVLFQISRDAEVLNTFATSLLKIPLYSKASLIHT
jgi:IS1 family transposase